MKTPEALRMVFEFIAVLSTIAEDGAHLNGALRQKLPDLKCCRCLNASLPQYSWVRSTDLMTDF